MRAWTHVDTTFGDFPGKPPKQTPAASPKAEPRASVPADRSVQLVIIGDGKHFADAIAALRAELQSAGIRSTVVQPDDAYDYRITFAQDNRDAAAAVALDARGNVVAMSVRGALTVKGAVEAASRELAKKLAAIAR